MFRPALGATTFLVLSLLTATADVADAAAAKAAKAPAPKAKPKPAAAKAKPKPAAAKAKPKPKPRATGKAGSGVGAKAAATYNAAKGKAGGKTRAAGAARVAKSKTRSGSKRTERRVNLRDRLKGAKRKGALAGATRSGRKGVVVGALTARRNGKVDDKARRATTASLKKAAGKGEARNNIDPDVVRAAAPNLSKKEAGKVANQLEKGADVAGIKTERGKANFVAQTAHETDGFKTTREYSSGQQYEGRSDLGNTKPGDGQRYKGRGYIQITGRANYAEASKDLGVNYVKNPERAANPEDAAKIAGWYYRERGISRQADAGNFTETTRRINGGQNGAADRQQRYERALAAN
jgi:predicted chitinase